MNDEYAMGLLIQGYAYVEMGRFDEAIKAHKAAVEIAPPWIYALGRTFAMAGEMDEARKILRDMESMEPSAWGTCNIELKIAFFTFFPDYPNLKSPFFSKSKF